MSSWGNTDDAANSVYYASEQFGKNANTTNQAALFGNTTAGGIVSGMKVGQFGVDTTEMSVANGSVVAYTITNPGSGYFANATVTVSGNATANATANSIGRISSVNVVLSGNSYTVPPSVTIAAPSKTINANNDVTSATDFIAISGNVFQNSDLLTYTVAAGNTAISGLANAASYYVVGANSTGIQLSTTVGGAAIDITKGLTETGHTLSGQTATAVAEVSGVSGKGFHAGWVIRKVGTGGRAGRVQYETLVAMGSITGDNEDTIFKDA